MIKTSYLVASILIALTTTETIAYDHNGNASGNIAGTEFNIPITCSIPPGSKALPSLFSFKSDGFSGNEPHRIKLSGQSLNGGKIMYLYQDDIQDKKILSNDFIVERGVLNDSGEVTNNVTKTSFSYNIVIKCK